MKSAIDEGISPRSAHAFAGHACVSSVVAKRKGRSGVHRTAHFRNCRLRAGSIADFFLARSVKLAPSSLTSHQAVRQAAQLRSFY
jgi:hypothetical protein